MKINFRHDINGVKLITAIAQDRDTKEILMVANMNKEALIKTIKTKKAHYWSTSRNKLWLKGETSNHIQYVHDILIDCDMDAVILKVTQTGAACHEGYYSCFFRKLNLENEIDIDNLKDEDYSEILNRLIDPEEVY